MFNKKRKYTFLPIVLEIAVSAAVFAACAALIRFAGTDPLVTVAIGLGAVVLLQLAVWGLYRFFTINTARPGDEMNPALGNMTLDLMIRLNMPVLILDENARVVWYNKSFVEAAGAKSVMYGKRFESYSPLPLDAVLAEENPDGAGLAAMGGHYLVKAYPTTVEDRNFTITVWQNSTELVEARRLLDEEDTVVAYIVIDNLDELIQYVQEKYRSASADVEEILKTWADSVDGIFKEYERDKFVFLFASKHLEQFVENKFEVIDRVRQVRVGEGGLPVTVSMGISQLGSTLSEKERNAHAALDMALQRGGDQVVVKLQGDNAIYGGRVQTAQKRTKVRARVFADQLASMISSASNVLVMSHARPDFDAVASSVGVARLCFFCGVRVNVITDMDNQDSRKCRERLASIPDYAGGIFVDPAEGQDLLQSDTLLIICDVSNPAQFEAPQVAANAANIVVIDHHRKTEDQAYEAAVNYIEPAASSASELVAEVLEHCLPAGSLPREEADLLLAGIMLDTKQFMRNTGSRTFGAALYLRQEGANPTLAQDLFRTGLHDLVKEAGFETNVVIYRGCIAIAKGEASENGTDRIAAAKAADKLLTVDGVAASFVVCDMRDMIHISARSSGQINVQLILERLGGGGHFDSAATQLRDLSVREALERLRKAIDDYMDETAD